jgi:hypothetical protein
MLGTTIKTLNFKISNTIILVNYRVKVAPNIHNSL